MQQSGIIPWTKFEGFVRLYRNTIEPQIFNEQEGILSKAQIEPLLPAYFKTLHSSLSTTIKEHCGEEIKKEEEEIEKCKIRMIIKVMSTIQTTLVTQESKRKHDMGTMIGSVKEDIMKMMGNNIPNEVIIDSKTIFLGTGNEKADLVNAMSAAIDVLSTPYPTSFGSLCTNVISNVK
jgi:hypothetical protein